MSDTAEQVQNIDNKAVLLAAARTVMARDGAKFSLRAVCGEAGLDRAELNKHFASRIALMAALVAAPEPVFQQQPPQIQAARPADTIVPEPAPAPAAPDAWLERRLRVFERALTALEAKAEASGREHARAIAMLEERLAAAQTAAAGAVPAAPVLPDVALTQAVAVIPMPAPPVASVEQEAEQEFEESEIMQLPAAVEAEVVQPAPQEDAEIPEIEVAPETGMVFPEPEVPRAETISREEMAEVLASARQAARNAAEDDATPADRNTARLRWLAAGVLGLVALFVCIGLTLGGTARATQNIQAGAGVMHRQLADNNFSRVMARADSGDVKAQAKLAFAYLRGDGVPGNAAAALRWASEAATHGEPMAEYLLGTFYQPGVNRGVKPDAAHAFQLFSAAAAQGNIKAMHNLAIAYAEGLGTAKDEIQAAQWFERAASHGYVDSAFDLAVLYERGLGVRQSLTDALRWYSIAAMAGDRPSADRAAFLRHQVTPRDAVVASNAAASFAPLAPITAANTL